MNQDGLEVSRKSPSHSKNSDNSLKGYKFSKINQESDFEETDLSFQSDVDLNIVEDYQNEFYKYMKSGEDLNGEERIKRGDMKKIFRRKVNFHLFQVSYS